MVKLLNTVGIKHNHIIKVYGYLWNMGVMDSVLSEVFKDLYCASYQCLFEINFGFHRETSLTLIEIFHMNMF